MRLPPAFLSCLNVATTSPFGALLPTHAAAVAATSARCKRTTTTTAAGSASQSRAASFASAPVSTSSFSGVASAAGNVSSSASSIPSAAAPGVFGIGVDIAHIPRFERLLQRQGARFLVKAMHPAEIQQLSRIVTADDKSSNSQTPLAAESAESADSSTAAASAAAADSDAAATAAAFVAASSSTTRLAAVTFVASRWAAKEAMVKATGQRLLFPEMRVARNSQKGAEGESNAHSGSRLSVA